MTTAEQLADPLVETPTEPSEGTAAEKHRSPGKTLGLSLAALGVVFGDIGTSPLYSLKTVFEMEHTSGPAAGDVFGVISMVFWAVMVIVTFKYVFFVMRADNDGEGGILALVALIKDTVATNRSRLLGVVMLLGMVGAGLFYGDSVITPAISVMSAVGGLKTINPTFETMILPLSVAVLSVLFLIQRWGTGKVGGAFGPIMLAWFGSLAALGLPWLIQRPEILGAVSPHHAVAYALDKPWAAFLAMGAVVLTITGAEALYADMGHFGAKPIRLAWLAVVLPSLFFCYMGQGAMLLMHPDYAEDPFFHMAPTWAKMPLVILATLATVIASQAVISGAFSVSRQATRLKLMPRLTVTQTSKLHGGQIYIPSINWALFMGVLMLISIFQREERLAAAYGLAVTGTLVLTTILFLINARFNWKWPLWVCVLFGVVVGGLETIIFAANLLKFFHGGWLPILIAGLIIVVMRTWYRGIKVIYERRRIVEGDLAEFLDHVNAPGTQFNRIPGFGVFPHRGRDTTPLAMRGLLQFAKALPETCLIVNVVNENVPHIRHVEREHLDTLGYDDGIYYVDCHVGFNDSQHIPKATQLAIETFPELAHLKEDEATYFLSSQEVKRDLDHHRMPTWERRLFVAIAKNQADARAVFHTPRERTVVLGSDLYL